MFDWPAPALVYARYNNLLDHSIVVRDTWVRFLGAGIRCAQRQNHDNPQYLLCHFFHLWLICS